MKPKIQFTLILFLFVLILNNISIAELFVPKPFTNPQNDDEYYFNFRLEHFAPDTDDLMTKTFGDSLEVDNVWIDVSYSSVVVGFSTNLPSIAMIKCYDVALNMVFETEQSESYFYNHLIYLKDLKEDFNYYLDIIMQDYDGNESIKYYMLKIPKRDSSIIRIPEDMIGEPPYNLTESNKKYVVTKDFTCPTLFINIKANDIEIDLNGHTIIYDDGEPVVKGEKWTDYAYNEEASMGIRAGLWNYKNVKLRNGIIKQGKNGGKGFVGVGYNPIFLNHMGEDSFNEISGVTVDYYGDDINGMICGKGYIHHNVVYDRGTVVSDRHQGIKAMIVEGGSGSGSEVCFNSLRRFRQSGINASCNIHHNELYSDSYVTNSFLIWNGDSSLISNNKLFGMGFNPVGIVWGSGMRVDSNFIYLHGTAPSHRSDEYERISGIAGVRFTNYTPDQPPAGTHYSNMLYEDNVIILKAWAGCSVARGIWTASNIVDSGVVYRRNIVKTELLSYDSINFDMVEYCVACVDINGASVSIDNLPPRILFEDNEFIGNSGLINFGSAYGVGSNSHFYRTKLTKINTFDSLFKPIRLGYYPSNTWNNYMIDNNIGEGINIDPPVFHHLGSQAGTMELYYGHAKEIRIFSECTGETITNIDVTIYTKWKNSNDTNYNMVLTTKTDDNGTLKLDVIDVRNFCVANNIQRWDSLDYIIEILDAKYEPYLTDNWSLSTDVDDYFIKCVESISEDNNIILSPVIATDYIVINGLVGNESIEISDITGNIVMICNVESEQEKINIKQLAIGTYFVAIKDKTKKTFIKKIIRE
jgi:hypothetical protein